MLLFMSVQEEPQDLSTSGDDFRGNYSAKLLRDMMSGPWQKNYNNYFLISLIKKITLKTLLLRYEELNIALYWLLFFI